MLELVEQTEVAIDEVIQVMGRATIEAVLEMSAEGVAGVKQAGRSRAEDDTVWYGRQGGVVYLSDRKVRVERIWREEGLKVPKKQPKRGRLWLTDGSCIRLRPLGSVAIFV